MASVTANLDNYNNKRPKQPITWSKQNTHDGAERKRGDGYIATYKVKPMKYILP